MNPEEKIAFEKMKRDLDDLQSIVFKKTGLGSSDIRGTLRTGSTLNIGTGAITKAMIGSDAVGTSELDTEVIDVAVSTGNTSGSGTCTAGSIILGVYPAGNQDQFIDNVEVSGTTVTITLGAGAGGNNAYKVVMLKV